LRCWNLAVAASRWQAGRDPNLPYAPSGSTPESGLPAASQRAAWLSKCGLGNSFARAIRYSKEAYMTDQKVLGLLRLPVSTIVAKYQTGQRLAVLVNPADPRRSVQFG